MARRRLPSALVPPSATASAPVAADPRREREGVLLCLLATAIFSGSLVLAKLGHAAGATMGTLLAIRFALASGVLWALAARRGGLRGVARRDGRRAFVLGLVMAGQTSLLFAALTRIEASLGELLTFVYPALVVLGAIALRHEPASPRRLVALALAMAGVALVLAGAGTGTLDPLGVALALGGAVLNAVYVLAAGRIGPRVPALTFSALLCSGAAAAFAIVGGAAGAVQLQLSAAAWAVGIALALGSTVCALTLFLAGVARLGAGRASILATLEPPLACLLAFALLGERLAPPQVLGGVLVVSAALVLQMRPLRSLRRGAPADPAAPTAARALPRLAARGRRMGVRAEVGRLPRDRVRRREPDAAPVARR